MHWLGDTVQHLRYWTGSSRHATHLSGTWSSQLDCRCRAIGDAWVQPNNLQTCCMVPGSRSQILQETFDPLYDLPRCRTQGADPHNRQNADRLRAHPYRKLDEQCAQSILGVPCIRLGTGPLIWHGASARAVPRPAVRPPYRRQLLIAERGPLLMASVAPLNRVFGFHCCGIVAGTHQRLNGSCRRWRKSCRRCCSIGK